MIADTVTWPAVALALITAFPAIIAAFYSNRNARSLRTTNDKTVGVMVSEVHGVESINGQQYARHTPGESDHPPAEA